MSDDQISVEATGETVGEAKWSAVRELQRRVPGIDRDAITFQIVTEGERGLLGVGYTPASVIASHANEVGSVEGRVRPGSKTEAFMKAVKAPVHIPLSGKTMEFDGDARCVAGC